MPEAPDVIVPILQGIQSDLGEVKRGVSHLEHQVSGLGDRMASVETYIAYAMGLQTQNRIDI